MFPKRGLHHAGAKDHLVIPIIHQPPEIEEARREGSFWARIWPFAGSQVLWASWRPDLGRFSESALFGPGTSRGTCRAGREPLVKGQTYSHYVSSIRYVWQGPLELISTCVFDRKEGNGA